MIEILILQRDIYLNTYFKNFIIIQCIWIFFEGQNLLIAQEKPLGSTDVEWIWDKQSSLIHVDQFGYLPKASKVAILANPQIGQNGHLTFQVDSIFFIKDGLNNIVYEGQVIPWKEKTIHSQSGDKVYYADFSSFREKGIYYVECGDQKSPLFQISDTVYNSALKAALRFYYYQRSNLALESKFAGEWSRPQNLAQQESAQLYYDFKPRGQAKDVRGGWFDAGDLNKYVPFIATTMYRLLMSYDYNPQIFTDDFNIPESGNGVPDLLDEIKWELDWLLKMQHANGGFHNRVGHRCGDYQTELVGKTNEPQYDKREYFYTPVTTWATAIGGASLAKAAQYFQQFSKQYPGYAQLLEERASMAWEYLQSHPTIEPNNGKDGAWHGTEFYESGGTQNKKELDLCHGEGASVIVGNPDFGGIDKQHRLWLATELLLLTQDTSFARYFEKNWEDKSLSTYGWFPLTMGFDPTQSNATFEQACMNYLRWEGANPKIKKRIEQLWYKGISSEIVFPYLQQWDAYRAYMPDQFYNWNSSEIITTTGGMLVHALAYGLDKSQINLYKEIAQSYLHRIHGQNPLGLCFMTNSRSFGADKCTMQIFGQLWGDLSPFDQNPPPGYILSGINQSFNLNSGRETPYDWINQEPPQKAYYPINDGWPIPGWELAEPALYTQSAYILLLSYFTRNQNE